MALIQLIGQSYQSHAKSFSSQRTINFFIEPVEDNFGKTKFIMRPTEGSRLISTASPVSGIGGRGNYYSSAGPAPDYKSRFYAVFGNTIFRYNSDMVPNAISGSIGNNSFPVKLIDNGFNLYAVDGKSLYKCPLTSPDDDLNLTAVSLPIIPGTEDTPIEPSQLAFVGQRIIINSINSNQWFYSNLPDADGNITFSDDNFYSAEQNADKIVGITNVAGNIWLFGTRSVEIWRGTGVELDPFSWIGGSSSQIGCKSVKSIATVNDLVFWLGASDVGENIVYRGSGTEIKRVSTNAIEEQIGKCPNAENSIGFAYYHNGKLFYVLSFKEDRRTFVYEDTTGLWHERSFRVLSTGEDYAWDPAYACFAYGKIYFSTLSANNICVLDENKYTEYDGRQIVRTRITPVYFNELDKWQLREFTIDMEVGATEELDPNIQGSNPQIMLQVSRDGGLTYGNELWKSIGKQGEYSTIPRWFNLGTGRNFVLKVQYSDPTPCTIYQGRIIVEKCGRT